MRFIKSLIIMLLLASAQLMQAEVNLIPRPSQVEEMGGTFVIQDGDMIGVSCKELLPAADYLKELLTRNTGIDIKVKKNDKGCKVRLVLENPDAEDESYTLDSSDDGIVIKARSYRGIINGISTLRQLLPYELESKELAGNVELTVPKVRIQDAPNFSWRGLMLDPVRHFYSIEETKELLDQMALYKMNKFHWHLIDDQACRIQFKGYPELTEGIGAYRDLIDIDYICIEEAEKWGSQDMLLPEKYFKEIDGKKVYGGFYTQEEIADVIEYAAVRGIDIIPEIDMPGHNTIACTIYPWLSCQEKGLSPFCIGKDSTIEYCEKIFDEIFALFPYEYVHIGGDEVNRTLWEDCPECQKHIKDNGLADEAELQSWFTKKMEVYFNQHGRRLIGWNEILEGGVSKTATIHWWRGDQPDVTQRATAMGNEVVLCPFTYCYFDYGQNDDTLRKLYDGDIVPTDLTPDQLKLVKGMQANIWCEKIPTVSRMQYMVFPRVLALAEKAWTPRNEQQWDVFFPRLLNHFKRLEAMGINYRPLVD